MLLENIFSLIKTYYLRIKNYYIEGRQVIFLLTSSILGVFLLRNFNKSMSSVLAKDTL